MISLSLPEWLSQLGFLSSPLSEWVKSTPGHLAGALVIGEVLRHGVNISISFISLLVWTITLGPLHGAFVFCHQVSDLSGAKAALPRLFPAAWFLTAKTFFISTILSQSLKLSLSVSTGLLARYLGPFSVFLKVIKSKWEKSCFFYKN